MSINIFFFLPSFFNIIDIDMFQLQMTLFLCAFFFLEGVGHFLSSVAKCEKPDPP